MCLQLVALPEKWILLPPTLLSPAVVDLIKSCCNLDLQILLPDESKSLFQVNFQDWGHSERVTLLVLSEVHKRSENSWPSFKCLPADDGTQLRGFWGFPSDGNTTREKTGPGQDHGHVSQSLTARPPPQRDSPCVGSGDLSHCEPPTPSVSPLKLTSALHQQR